MDALDETTIGTRGADPVITGLGVAVGAVTAPAPGMRVIKSGRTTEITRGIVGGRKVIGVLFPGFAARHKFNVHVISPPAGAGSAPIAGEGDSGASWMLENDAGVTDTMVALHLGGDPVTNVAYACAADAVFARLGLSPISTADLTPAAPSAPTPLKRSLPYRVIARSLRVRAGPGPEFPRLDARSHGDIVHVVGASGDWLMVDLHGDGKADGYMFGGLLEAVATV